MRTILLILFASAVSSAQTALPGRGVFLPDIPIHMLIGTTGINVQTWGTSDLTGEKAAMCGYVFFSTHTGSKAIQRVGFKWGAVTKSGGSALTISLQDHDTGGAVGVMRPDGTPDQTVAVLNADAGWAFNLWYRSNTFNTNRTVSFGDSLCVVVEFDGAGRITPDSFLLSGFEPGGTSQLLHTAQAVSSTAAAVWSVTTTALPSLVLEFSDGTFGTLDQLFPVFNTPNAHSINNASTPNEFSNEFVPTISGSIDALYALVMTSTNQADYELNLYNAAGAVLASASVDANTTGTSGAGGARWVIRPVGQVGITAGQTYRIGVKATTANNISLFSFDVQDSNHFHLHSGGPSWKYTTRTGLGAWAAATTTRRLLAGVRVSAITSGGGGTMVSVAVQ